MKLKLKAVQSFVIFCTLLSLSLFSGCRAASLTIAENGESTFSIVVPEVAAKPVNDAAAEMQLDIAQATGAKLPIVKDNATISGPFISLGSTKQAQAANITTDDIPAEGFRIVTQNGDLFIIGLDTTTVNLNREDGKVNRRTPKDKLHPEISGPAFTENGGYSRGTANGVYTFLENQLGVRWLMPGDLGRDVPTRKIFQLEEMDRTQAPEFIYRKILDVGGAPWRDHQRLGYSFRDNHRHSFSVVVPPSLYDEHPEWFAMDSSGHRPRPDANDRVGNNDYKLETTNPELVEYYAQKAVEELKAHPQLNTFSISPTDSGGWSQSPESKLFYDPPPPGEYGQSSTRLVLKWYSDVSAIVAKEYPQGKLAGLIYGGYRYAPETGGVKMPDNFIPVFTHPANGYSMYRPEASAASTKYLEDWSKYLPETWLYYAHPLWIRGTTASLAYVTPAAPESLNAMFGNLVKYHARGVMFYGNKDWGASAIKNYILAQMLWNPQADAKEIQHDWLMRAYGPQAGAIMEEFYNKLDAHWFSDRIRSGASGTILQVVYGAHYPQMEELFLKAWNQPMTAKQKARLGLLRDQMAVLQWRLRSAGYLPAGYASPLQADAKQVFQLLTATNKDFQIFNNAARGIARFKGTSITDVKVKLASPAITKTGAQSPPLPNASSILLFPTQAGEVTIHPAEVHPGNEIVLYAVQDKQGKTVDRGLLSQGQDIVFKAGSNEPYYLYLSDAAKTTDWNISISQSTAVFRAAFQDGVVSLYPDKAGAVPLYVYVPEKLPWKMETEADGIAIHPRPVDVKANKADDAKHAARLAVRAAGKRYKAERWAILDQGWRFKTDPQQSGEGQGFAKVNFEDDSWKVLSTIGTWQSHGVDYHGTAWYRKTFNPFEKGDEPLLLAGRRVLLFFGAVDGDAVFYLNDKKIGEHKMLDPAMSWQVPVVFDVTDVIHADSNNTIAVKVTKDRKASGIYKGVSLLVGTLPEQ